MQTLGEILRSDDPAYVRYLSRKTQYLITQEKSEYVQRFWQHLIIEHHPRQIIPHLLKREKKTLTTLLQNFAHDARTTMRAQYQSLEKKVPWVLQHPDGAYFIPYEIIKTLMPTRDLIEDNFLFQLLYKMPEAEKQALRTLLARSHRSREALSAERHPLDKALALYIWTAEHQRGFQAPRRRTTNNIWAYLKIEFPRLEDELEEWQDIMQRGRKGFYRSLSLIRGSGAELLKGYIATLRIVPASPRRQKYFSAQNLRFVIPREFLTRKSAAKS